MSSDSTIVTTEPQPTTSKRRGQRSVPLNNIDLHLPEPNLHTTVQISLLHIDVQI